MCLKYNFKYILIILACVSSGTHNLQAVFFTFDFSTQNDGCRPGRS